MKKSLLLFALLLWVGVQTVMAQTKAKGRVIDGESKNQTGLFGVNVKVVGTTAGTTTDDNGNFEIDVPEKNNGKLELSTVGYGTQTVSISDNIVVTMKSETNVLTGVTITTPYGPPVTKEKYVGAADVVTAKKIENTPVADLTKAIEGAAPGVQVTNGSGAPGSGASIQIRGRGSLSASTSPLIVLDGAPYDGDLTSINPIDIASMNILKDAMATSLYGARGSNGVIVINTKRGKSGEKPRITVDGKMGTVTRGLPNYNMITSAADYYELAWRGQYNKNYSAALANLPAKPSAAQLANASKRAGTDASGITTLLGTVDQLGYNAFRLPGVGDTVQNAYLLDPTTGKVNPNAQLLYQDDWSKAIQKTGLRQEYNFNVSGATEKSDYYLSAGYLNEKGYIINSGYERFTTRLNVNTQATDWLKVGLNVAGTLGTYKGQGVQTGSGANTGNAVFLAMTTAPIYPVYYHDANNNLVIDPRTGENKLDYGSTANDPSYSMGTRGNNAGDNIVGMLQNNIPQLKTANVVAIPYMTIKILPELNFTTRLNTSFTNYNSTDFSTVYHGQFKGQGNLQKYMQNYFSYTWNQMLTYSKVFGDKHDLTVTAGHENYSFNTSYQLGSVGGFISDQLKEFSVATGTPSLQSKSDNDRLESYLAVANYTYNNKYAFQANIRRDGLSRFYQDVRWGNFGGVGAAWIIKNEDFLKDVSWLSNLKIKGSYGTTGNSQVAKADGSQNYYGYQALYDASRPNGGQAAAIPITLQNNNLKWEAQKALNFGTEFSLFGERISGEVNVYNRQTSNLYFNVPNPPSTGIHSQLLNTGDMYNRGLEIALYATVVKTRDFTWNINTNWYKNVNKITKLADGLDSVITGNTILKPGYDYSSFYLVHSSGINHANGDELYDYIDPKTGNVKQTMNYNDSALLNGKRIVGNATPKFQGAITNTISYKGFEFSFLISYSVGGKYYDATYQGIMGDALTKIGSTNFSKDLMNSWTAENPNGSLPRFEWDNKNIGGTSDRFLVDASYISIRNVNLRYSFPTTLITKTHLSSLSAYVAADNVAFFSKRAGMNPQGDLYGQVSYPYNPARTIMVGLTVGL